MARRAEMMRRLLPTQLYDLAIVEWPIDHPSVQVEEFELRCVCALPESHKLIERSVIGPRDLDGLPFVSLLPEHTNHSQLESAFAEAGAAWNVAIETQTMESVSAFIRQRAGVGLLDPFSARHGENNGIVVRRFEPAIIYRIAMLLPRDRMRSSILEEFIETVKSEFDTVGNPARRRQGRKSARSTSA